MIERDYHNRRSFGGTLRSLTAIFKYLALDYYPND